MKEKDAAGWLSIARDAALLSGGFLASRDKSGMKINSEDGRDIKINADTESERIILDCLKEKTDFSILSEEAGFIERGRQGLIWTVDPLDGSFNYVRGIPLSCVSIGLWRGEEPLLGVVHDFNRSETFSGIVGKGARLNGADLKVSGVPKKEKAVLCTGFPVNTDFSSENIKAFIDNVSSYKKTRLLGSAALSIAYVASGRADIYYERDIMLWDVGGAIPILLAAGGKVEMEKARKKYSYCIRASNGSLEK